MRDRDPSDDWHDFRSVAPRLAGGRSRAISWGWIIALVILMASSLYAGARIGSVIRRSRSTSSITLILVRLRAPRLPIIVERTAYSLDVDQTDADPFTGRCGRIEPRGVPAGGGRVLPAIAVSRDLLPFADCGARVTLDGKTYVVWDTMAAHWRRRVDVLAMSRAEAVALGRRNGLLVLRP